MLKNGDAETMYDAPNKFDRDTVLGVRSRRWAHWGGHGVVLRNDDTQYVEMPFIPGGTEYGYVSRLAAVIVQCYLLSAEDLRIAGLYYICRVEPYAQVNVLTTYDTRPKK